MLFALTMTILIIVGLILFFGWNLFFKDIIPLKKKNVIALHIIISLAILCLFCIEKINPGEVGVIVNMLGNKKGAEEKEIHVGVYFIRPWCTVYKFPIYEQNHQWVGKEAFNFQTTEGLSVRADIGITFNLEPIYIHKLFSKYRRGMEEITHLFIRNNLRDALNRTAAKMRIEDLYGPNKEMFFDEIQKQMRTELAPLGFNISHLYIIGQFNVPDTVRKALNAKIEAIQRAQQRENELREAEAEAKKRIAKADAEAKSNMLVSKSLSPELLKWESIKKWDGKLPLYTGNNIPFIFNSK